MASHSHVSVFLLHAGAGASYLKAWAALKAFTPQQVAEMEECARYLRRSRRGGGPLQLLLPLPAAVVVAAAAAAAAAAVVICVAAWQVACHSLLATSVGGC